MNMLKKNGGFTLVELIVVIAILAILAAVAVPAYNGYIKEANDAAVKTELSGLSTAIIAANATSSQVTAISVNGACTEVTITASSFSDDFEEDFETFYGITNKDDVSFSGGKLTFKNAPIDFGSSSYKTSGATYGINGWDVTK